MGNLYERLHILCVDRGVSAAKMCREVGVSKSLMTDLKSGRKKGVNADTAHKLASYFEVSVGYLLGEDDKPTQIDGLSEKRKALIEFARSVPDDKADMILRVMRSIVEAD